MAKASKAAKKKAGKKKAAKKKAARRAPARKAPKKAVRKAVKTAVRKAVRKAARKAASAVSFAVEAVTAAVTSAATANKTVTFACSNPGCMVNLTIGSDSFSFAGSTSVSLAPGKHTLFYSVQGSGAYDLTAAGATLSAPISSSAPDTGVRLLTVGGDPTED